MDKQLKKRLNQDIILESYLSQNGAGEPTYKVATNIKGYIAGQTTVRIGPSGEQLVSQQTLFVDETVAAHVKPKDRITPPDTSRYIVKDVQRFYKELGPLDYAEVYL